MTETRARSPQRPGDLLRTGAYMTRERAIVGTAIFGLWCLIGFAAVVVTSDGVMDFKGRPLGTDFIVLYTGGKVALADGAAAVYDVNRIFAEHQAVLRQSSPDWGPFFYPPVFIFAAMALALVPYAPAWIAWMGATGALYVAGTRRIAKFPGRTIPILAFSAVFMNLMQGQTGFLLAGLFAGGLVALFSKRPILAGVLLGLIALKPQFGVLVPIALAAGGHWRAFAAAAATVLLLIVAPTAAFGPDIWEGFAGTARIARIEVLEKGGIGYFKIASVFAQARMLGAPVIAAYALQALVAAGAAALVFVAWRARISGPLKAATLILATLLAQPYVVEYDLVLLAPAVAFLIAEAMRNCFRDYEKTLLVFVFLAPALTRFVASWTSVSLGLVAAALLFAATLARVRGARDGPIPDVAAAA